MCSNVPREDSKNNRAFQVIVDRTTLPKYKAVGQFPLHTWLIPRRTTASRIQRSKFNWTRLVRNGAGGIRNWHERRPGKAIEFAATSPDHRP